MEAVKIFLPHRSVVNVISLIRQGFSSKVLPFLPHLYLIQIIDAAHSLHESPPTIRTLTGSKRLGVLFFLTDTPKGFSLKGLLPVRARRDKLAPVIDTLAKWGLIVILSAWSHCKGPALDRV